MFRTSICPSSGVQVVYCCMWCSALSVVAVVLRSRCVVLCTACVSLYPTYRCPKKVELFMIINHNRCIKLVTLVIFLKAIIFITFNGRHIVNRRGSVRTTYHGGRVRATHFAVVKQKVFVALDIQHEMRMRHIVVFRPSCSAIFFHIIP